MSFQWQGCTDIVCPLSEMTASLLSIFLGSGLVDKFVAEPVLRLAVGGFVVDDDVDVEESGLPFVPSIFDVSSVGVEAVGFDVSFLDVVVLDADRSAVEGDVERGRFAAEPSLVAVAVCWPLVLRDVVTTGDVERRKGVSLPLLPALGDMGFAAVAEAIALANGPFALSEIVVEAASPISLSPCASTALPLPFLFFELVLMASTAVLSSTAAEAVPLVPSAVAAAAVAAAAASARAGDLPVLCFLVGCNVDVDVDAAA